MRISRDAHDTLPRVQHFSAFHGTGEADVQLVYGGHCGDDCGDDMLVNYCSDEPQLMYF